MATGNALTPDVYGFFEQHRDIKATIKRMRPRTLVFSGWDLPSDVSPSTLSLPLDSSSHSLIPSQTVIDLLLIHWPGTQGRKVHDERNATNRQGSWRALQQFYKEGHARAIGVSNFTVEHLKELVAVKEGEEQG